MLGTIVNVGAIIVGSGIGLLIKGGLPERFRNSIMQALALFVIIVGIMGATGTSNAILVLICLVIGTIIGEIINIDRKLEIFGDKVKDRFSKNSESNFAQGFITGSLVYCVGAMAIVGSLNAAIKGDNSILYTKAVLDGVSAVLFTSVYGISVMLAAVSVLIYQGAITLLAGIIAPYLSSAAIAEMSAVGGVLILGLGFSIMEIKRVKVANMLPAVFLPPIYLLIESLFK